MKERESIVVGGLVTVLLILWLGFLFHRSPDFAGSLVGGVLAITGSLLMLVPLAYLLVKRIAPLRSWVTRFVSMRTLLAWHIYAGVLGPILVLLHTGHKFVSPLGIALTAMTLLVVVSGFTGRYLMGQLSQTIREKQSMLTQLEAAYREAAGRLAADPHRAERLSGMPRLLLRLYAWFTPMRAATHETDPFIDVHAIGLADSIADVEYAIRTHELFKRAFAVWLRFHLAISIVLYVLLGLHVWSGIHFGLRWFE